MNAVFYTQVFPELLVRASYPGDSEHTDALLTLPSRLTSSTAAMTPGAAWSANCMTTFYHLQPGSFEYAEFYEKPLPHWLVCFADTASGPIQHLVFAVMFSDGQIVQPSFSERL